MLNSLRKLGRQLTQTEARESASQTPTEALMRARQLGAVHQALRDGTISDDVETLLVHARQYGWSKNDAEKLEIVCLFERLDFRQAAEKAQKFVSGEAFDPAFFVLAVSSYYQCGRFQDANRLLRLPESCHPAVQSRQDFVNLAALVCAASGPLVEAKPFLEKALTLYPDDPFIAQNALDMYFEMNEQEAFERVYRDMKSGRFRLDEIGYALGCIEMARGNYADGFSLMETRYANSAYRHLNPALHSFPRWSGESLAGKTLLVSAEQGLGDTIQLSRFLRPLAKQYSPAAIVFETPPQTKHLFDASLPGVRTVDHRHGSLPAADFDIWIGSFSLPHRLGISAEAVPGRNGYLQPPSEVAEYWRQRVTELSKGGRARIGLAWSGRKSHPANFRRSLPFDLVVKLVADLDADFFALQTEVPVTRPNNLIDVSEELMSLADTAALIAQMDMVVTIDTCAVHLAGALGARTLLLVPYRWEWRWGLEGAANSWYDSVEVLRQASPGAWEALLDGTLRERLRAVLSIPTN